MDLELIDGLTETQPDTEQLTARLVELLESHPGRSQDALQDSVYSLERAYTLEANAKVRSLIQDALDLLRNGPDDTAESTWKDR